VLIVGDWGAPLDRPEFGATQRLVLRGMEQVARAAKHRVTHVVNLGDAFYMDGKGLSAGLHGGLYGRRGGSGVVHG
jgi:hypothetical protein